MKTWLTPRVRNGQSTGWARRLVVAATGGALVITLVPGLPAAADEEREQRRPAVERMSSVPGRLAEALPLPADPAAEAVLRDAPATAWPEAGAAEVELAGATDAHRPTASGRARAGTLPVWVGPAAAGAAAGRSATPGDRPDRVRVAMLGREAARNAGLSGVLLRVGRADGKAGSGPVALEVDYSAFRHAFGGDWAARLRLVRLPDCALTAPEVASCQTPTVVPTRNDVQTGRLTAQVDAGPAPVGPLATQSTGGTVYAVTADEQGDTGDYSATKLSPSASWQVSTQTGDFSWNYPMRVPPSAGELSPEFSLSYSASGVDGRTVSTNNQPSWVGEGFDLWAGYIEREYKPCLRDRSGGNNSDRKTGDLCWGNHNAVLVLNGQASELVRDGSSNKWRAKNDDGSRIEHLTGAANGDNNGEYWRVTDTDGVQYYFGRHRLPGWTSGKAVTRSTWTAPVFGNHSGEPCHEAEFSGSWCQQAWRWNLDYVVDPNGNAMRFFYAKERNHYGRNLTATAETPYTRGGYLKRIDYGLRHDAAYARAPARVVFAVAERCYKGGSVTCRPSELNSDTAKHWPDVPWDKNCAAGSTCTDNFSPTFWSRKRLASLTTSVWNGSRYRAVDTWTLTHSFPKPGDGTSAALWLKSIKHSGHVGGSASLPAVTFQGVQKENRVDALEGIAPMIKWRISSITSEAGGVIAVNYADTNCSRSALPRKDTNPKRCFPQYWQPEGELNPKIDWFHKYVVAQVLEIDRTGRAPTEETNYDYVGGAAWRYNNSAAPIPSKFRTWSRWRGYQRVRITHGAAGERRSRTEHLFFRGMDGDRLSGGGRRNVKVTDSTGTAIADHWRLRGFERESITRNGPGGAVVSASISTPWRRATASSGSRTAFLLGTAVERERIALESGGWRRTEVRRAFDTDGIVTRENDLGDLATAADDRCTRYSYARNRAKWMLTYESRVETVEAACGASPRRPADVISDVRTYYDGATAPGTAPRRGNVTKTEKLASWNGGPVYVTESRSTYDAFGRALDEYDAAGNKTTTRYAPASGLATRATVTNPLGHVTTTHLEPAWGQPVAEVDANGKRTDLAYDPLGRLTKVWLPDRPKSSGASPNLRFSYRVRTNAPTVVTTETIRNDGTYTASHELLDSLLRARQTQAPAPDGGRVITDTFYNTRGLVEKENAAYYNDQAPGTSLFLVADNQVPSQTVHVFDGAERETAAIFRVLGKEKWRTTTIYGGDRTHVHPPSGEAPTTEIVDARDRVVERRRYKGGTPSGDYDATTYTYAKNDELATVTDPADNVWRYFYDLRGRKVREEDPDAGAATHAYDDLDRLTSTTDARGITLAYTYDVLGRKTGVFEGSAEGVQRARWTYDTLAKGKLTSSTRYVDGNAYTQAVTAYDSRYRATDTEVTIPAAEGALAGTYPFETRYNVDGTVAHKRLPAAGGLPEEIVRFTYDELGNPLTVKGLGLSSYVTDTLYSKFGEPLQHELHTGSAGVPKTWLTSFYEEGTRRLARARVDRESVDWADTDAHYTYDPAGNVTAIADEPVGAPASQPPETQCFRYDHARRLTEAWTAGSGDCAVGPSLSVLGGPAPYWHSYTYDTVGNRLTETRHASTGDVRRSYAYQTDGSAGPHALRSVSTEGPDGTRLDEYAYDEAGNTTGRVLDGSAQDLEWDAEGHLATVTDGGKVTSFVYDTDGDRLLRRDPEGTTLYFDDMELRLNAASGGVSATRYYSLGTATVVRTPGGLSWLASDHHGTAQLAIDARNGELTRRRLTPFGGRRGEEEAEWPGEKGFVGGTIDVSTGLTHLGAREYDPSTGRFISVDPVIDVGDLEQMHGYAYANNNPLAFTDPDGLKYSSCHGWECAAIANHRRKKKSRSRSSSRSSSSCHGWECAAIANHRSKTRSSGGGSSSRRRSYSSNSCHGWECAAIANHRRKTRSYNSCVGWECAAIRSKAAVLSYPRSDRRIPCSLDPYGCAAKISKDDARAARRTLSSIFGPIGSYFKNNWRSYAYWVILLGGGALTLACGLATAGACAGAGGILIGMALGAVTTTGAYAVGEGRKTGKGYAINAARGGIPTGGTLTLARAITRGSTSKARYFTDFFTRDVTIRNYKFTPTVINHMGFGTKYPTPY